MAQYTTFKIGGFCRYFFVAKNSEDIIRAVETAQKCGTPFFILGGGSNLLISDKGFNGLIIKIHNSKFKISPSGRSPGGRQNSKIYADAGTPLGLVVSRAAEAGLMSLEWAAGIPGTIGGAIRGNAGAFGHSMADIVKTVKVLEISVSQIRNSKFEARNKFQIQNFSLREISRRETKFQTKIFRNKDCKFGYRGSIFKQNPNLIILSAELQLRNGNKEEIRKKTEECLEYRRIGHPLNYPSAGSIFKNYELRFKNYELLLKKFPELKQSQERGNIPAAYLISECGLKGKEIGGAMISEKHPNFIVNANEAKAKDVVALIKLIKQKVEAKFGILLEEEIQYLGFGSCKKTSII